MGSLKAHLSALRSGFGRFLRHLSHGGPAYGVLLMLVLIPVTVWMRRLMGKSPRVVD